MHEEYVGLTKENKEIYKCPFLLNMGLLFVVLFSVMWQYSLHESHILTITF